MTASFSPVAVVTGGARGIGLAVAQWFLSHGHRVALRDTDAATLRATEAALDDPSRAQAIPCDVSQPAQVTDATVQTESHFGRIDALVNNAGVAVFKPIGQTSFEERQTMLGIHLTQQQATELGTMGIRVNAVALGPIDTEMAKLVHSAAIGSDYRDVIPLERYGTTDAIANAMGFLRSAAANSVNAQVPAVDGGFDAAGVGLPTLRKTAAAPARQVAGKTRLRRSDS
jgi:NAD(P)-dependent dehydrogenase (short-subunit alcohol dehydrogenase family)